MFSVTEYNRTGRWPSFDIIAKKTNDTQISEFANKAVQQADQSKVDSIVNEVTGNGFLPSIDSSDLINKFSELIFAVGLRPPASGLRPPERNNANIQTCFRSRAS